ncbi:head GIN domain-containing protein [Oceanihabitans sp. 2_MG-2023]|uniref:head GIN domain-containing protein n=1 Tax=Oceanihabitans sp. 2_MG-2023 TaxID=3062661 RepID=UPI0026E21502|nr:head GIN domain-containing protein [Oceanihabitans sp. 2_MG-2023]MDO6595834.1 head GIN domain-containing protein [Oceanihabitans sp. 2_MG-2023]
MKKLLYFLFLITTITTFAQESQKTTIGEFSEIKVYDRIEVELIKADENKVVVSGKNTEDLVIVHKKDILKIRMTLQKAFNGDETTVQVYYTSLDVIDANEGTFIGSNDVIEQFDLNVKAQEGGTVTLQVKDLNYLDIKSVSGANINISGTTTNQNIDINTGGSYKAKDLISENATVTIKAAGVAHIHTTKKVEAKVRAGGSVYIYGNPEIVDENTILGGKIIIKE